MRVLVHGERDPGALGGDDRRRALPRHAPALAERVERGAGEHGDAVAQRGLVDVEAGMVMRERRPELLVAAADPEERRGATAQ